MATRPQRRFRVVAESRREPLISNGVMAMLKLTTNTSRSASGFANM